MMDIAESKKTKQCFVSMLDILGTSNILCSKDQLKINKYIVNLENLYDEVYEKMNLDQCTFSDNIFIHTNSCADDEFNDLILHLASFQFIAIVEYDFLLRGGVSQGGLYHPHKNTQYDFITGDAVISAHKLESRDALYPRIVIARELYDKYKNKIDPKFILMEGKMPYINYLSSASTEEFIDEDLIQSHRDALIRHIHQNNELNINSEEWDRIRAKDIWILSYHNNFCRENDLDFRINYYEEYDRAKEKIMIELLYNEGQA